jgi:aarF domain-containing kinase
LTGHGKKDDPKSTARKTRRHKEANCIKVPKIYWDLTRRAVLTMEWIDGIKLTDEIGLKTACLNRKELIDQVLGRNLSTSMCSGNLK